MSMTFLSALRLQRHVRGLVAVIRNLIALACPRMTSCRRVATPHAPVTLCPRDVAVSVTLSRQARRHVRGLIAVVRILIATPCDLASACRHSPHTCDAMSVTFILPSRAQRYVCSLIAFVRVMIVVSYLHMTLRGVSPSRDAPAVMFAELWRLFVF